MFEVVRSVEIDCDADTVRRQFGDVAHHAETGVHHGVVFEVVDDDGSHCSYRQTAQVGPLQLRQELELDRTETGPLVNRIVAGQFTGGSIAFDVEPRGEGRAVVEARLSAPLSGAMRVVAPLLRMQVGRQLATALAEDKADLEEGGYGRSGRPRG